MAIINWLGLYTTQEEESDFLRRHLRAICGASRFVDDDSIDCLD